MMSCKSYGVTAIDVMRLQGLVGETIHICLAAHAIWCGSYVFGGSEWPSGPSREIRLFQNNEILHNALQFQRIPHYNVKKLSYTKIQPSSIRFNGVSDGPLPCVSS
ncbi:hypothetical protein T12_13158 [Trichinella patagoniensis]|uniref:Uncharacterized protein n=2 Tax=Trichinella patagoniensis TaxID=990121 RepID=A0A0V1AD90_9BILA|nr:hypothetical protein T12_13158 [Trichinella patagoniensis]